MPGGIYRINTEYQVGCSKLSVRVHEDFGPKDEVEISHVHNLEIWLKSPSFYNKSTKRPVSLYVNN